MEKTIELIDGKIIEIVTTETELTCEQVENRLASLKAQKADHDEKSIALQAEIDILEPKCVTFKAALEVVEEVVTEEEVAETPSEEEVVETPVEEEITEEETPIEEEAVIEE